MLPLIDLTAIRHPARAMELASSNAGARAYVREQQAANEVPPLTAW